MSGWERLHVAESRRRRFAYENDDNDDEDHLLQCYRDNVAFFLWKLGDQIQVR